MKLIPVWHGHHGTLISWLPSVEDRIKDIKTYKPKSEHALRKRLIKPVEGTLPAIVVKAWKACNKADAAYDKAGEACKKAGEAYSKVWVACKKTKDACKKAEEACKKVKEVLWKAWVACKKADAAYDKVYRKHLPAIEALHKKECPNCPWDGETIFGAKK